MTFSHGNLNHRYNFIFKALEDTHIDRIIDDLDEIYFFCLRDEWYSDEFRMNKIPQFEPPKSFYFKKYESIICEAYLPEWKIKLFMVSKKYRILEF